MTVNKETSSCYVFCLFLVFELQKDIDFLIFGGGPSLLSLLVFFIFPFSFYFPIQKLNLSNRHRSIVL